MSVNYVIDVGKEFHPDPAEPVMEGIFQQYERVIIESLVTSFGLDFLIRDQHGGDVDTIHNVRQIGQDEQMTYKNARNQQAYDNREPYGKDVKRKYDSDSRFINVSAQISRQKKAGNLTDAYTGQKVARNADIEIDHVIATKEIHDDRGRVLAGLDGIALANSRENLQPTDHSINESMKQKSIDEYCEWLKKTEPKRAEELKKLYAKPQSDLTDKERKLLHKYEQQAMADPQKMKKIDAAARKSYEAKLAKAYYTSPKFAKDLALAAGNVSIRMGARQVLGFVFAEMWFAVKEEFQKVSGKFDLSEFVERLGLAIKTGFERAKKKYAELFSKFLSGAVAGALSSLTTTLCNIFFTTAKNTVRIIRQSFASFVEAGKVLFFNPENYTFGDRIRAVAKILATGASVVAGVMVGDMVGKAGLFAIPVLGDVMQAFCSSFVTGIMSCTFLYYFDRSEVMNKLVNRLDGLHTIETEIKYYRQQADYFEQHAAQLMKIDIMQLHQETALYHSILGNIESAGTNEELNMVLKRAYLEIGGVIPWKDGGRNFDDFMHNRHACLTFE